MKKIIVLCILLILSSCSIDWNGEKDKKIAELEKQIESLKKDKENDLFKKKQECVKYKNDMLEFAKNYNNSTYELDEIFYSDYKKSCFFIAKVSEPFGVHILFDYLNQTYISSNGADICLKGNINNCEQLELNERVDFDNKIKELKGE